MASPQTEEGFTKVANEILDFIMKTPLNGTQFRIVLAIWRFTYGFQRKEHEMSIDFIATATEINTDQIRQELKKLIQRKMIIVTKEAVGVRSRTVSFNKNYDEWLEGVKKPSLAKESPNEFTPPHRMDSPSLEGVNSPPKKEKRKSLKKDIYIEPKTQFLDMVFLKETEYQNLLNLYGKEELDFWIFTLNTWLVNDPKNQKKVTDHNLTIQNWKRREERNNKQVNNRTNSKQQKKKEQDDILLDFYKEGAASEANGNGDNAKNNKDRLPLF